MIHLVTRMLCKLDIQFIHAQAEDFDAAGCVARARDVADQVNRLGPFDTVIHMLASVTGCFCGNEKRRTNC